MRSTFFITIAALAASVSAYPLMRRDVSSELGIFNFALTLEHLETAFYTEGLGKFSKADFEHAGYDGKIRDIFEGILIHESTHVSTLTNVIKGLNGHPVPECKYNFPLTDVHSFLAISRALEETGTSAYAGAAAGLEGGLLTAAATINTIEARQSSVLNELNGGLGVPYSFDTPLSAREVFTIASNLIVSCPFDLGIKPFNQLMVTLPKAGDKDVKVMTDFTASHGRKGTHCQFLYSDKVRVSPIEECALPATVVGYVYVLITDSAVPVTLLDDGASVVAGPALTFVSNDY